VTFWAALQDASLLPKPRVERVRLVKLKASLSAVIAVLVAGGCLPLAGVHDRVAFGNN